MPTLDISGKKITVDDSFLSLSPEEQNKTVDHIASQLGNAAPTPQTRIDQAFEGVDPARVLPSGILAFTGTMDVAKQNLPYPNNQGAFSGAMQGQGASELFKDAANVGRAGLNILNILKQRADAKYADTLNRGVLGGAVNDIYSPVARVAGAVYDTGKALVEGGVDAVRLVGDVYSGKQQIYDMNPNTGEMEFNRGSYNVNLKTGEQEYSPSILERTGNLAGFAAGGASIPAARSAARRALAPADIGGEVAASRLPPIGAATPENGAFWSKRAAENQDKALYKSPAARIVREAVGDIPDDVIMSAEALMGRAQDQGINLTWAEALNQASGGAYQRLAKIQQVLETSPKSSQIISEYIGDRAGQINRAASETFDNVSSTIVDPVRDAINASKTATGAIKSAQKQRTEAVNPYYSAANKEKAAPDDVRAVISYLDSVIAEDATTSAAAAARQIRKNLVADEAVPAVAPKREAYIPAGAVKPMYKTTGGQAEKPLTPVTDIKSLNDIYIEARDQHVKSPQKQIFLSSADKNAVIKSSQALGGLDNVLRKNSNILKGREEYARISDELVNPLKSGPLGKISKTENITKQGLSLFPSSPSANQNIVTGDAIKRLVSSNPDSANNIVRHHLETVFINSTKDLMSGANKSGGAKFAAKIAGSEEQRATIKAGLEALPNGEAKYQAFNNLIETLKATGQRIPSGSDTQLRNEISQAMGVGGVKGEAANIVAGAGVKFPQRIKEMYERYTYRKNSENLAKILTDPSYEKLLSVVAKSKSNSPLRASSVNAVMSKVERENTKLKNTLKQAEDTGVGENVAALYTGALDRSSKISKHTVTSADGVKIDVEPMVVEASDLVTSYSPNYPKELQPRDRTRAVSDFQVNDIAKKLDPERLGYSSEADRGAPIIGGDMLVESGNGRVSAIMQSYKEGGANSQAYKDYLQKQGFDISGMQNPVLVRKRVTDLNPDQRVRFAQSANMSSTLQQSATEKAAQDSKLITSGMLDAIENTSDVASPKNKGFISAFIGKLPKTEHGIFFDANNQLSAEGAKRVQNALLHAAYDDTSVLRRMAESLDDNVKGLTGGLQQAAPEWVKMRSAVKDGTINKDFDITEKLNKAINLISYLRDKNIKIKDHFNQQDAFDVDPFIEEIVRAFYPSERVISKLKIGELLSEYARIARGSGGGANAPSFLDDAVSPKDVLNNAMKKTVKYDENAAMKYEDAMKQKGAGDGKSK